MNTPTELEVELRLSQKKVKNDNWKKGHRITKEQLTNARLVDDVSEHFGRRKVKEIDINADGGFVSKTVNFGKHKGRTYHWIYKNDAYWWSWAIENIQGFRDKAEAAEYQKP